MTIFFGHMPVSGRIWLQAANGKISHQTWISKVPDQMVHSKEMLEFNNKGSIRIFSKIKIARHDGQRAMVKKQARNSVQQNLLHRNCKTSMVCWPCFFTICDPAVCSHFTSKASVPPGWL